MKELTDELYEKKDFSKKPYVLFFTTTNCPNCETVESYLNQINADKLKPCYIDIYKVKAEKNKILVELFLKNNGIRAFPVTFFIKNNEAITIIGSKKIGEFILNIKKICKDEKKTLTLKYLKIKEYVFGDNDE